MIFRSFVAAAGLLLASSPLAGPACANEPTVVRVNTFPTARSLPFFAGLAKGIFAKHGLKVEVVFTENSRQQREGLAAGKTDVVHSALDNAIAMIEVAKHDVVIVAGRRQRHQRVLRAARDQILRRSARPHHRRRCARYRLCAARQEDPGAARAQGRRRLHGEADRPRQHAPAGARREQGARRRAC